MGRFLTVEGGEGVGKTTFITQLVDTLMHFHGINVVATFEPGGTPLANRYREIFNSTPEGEPMFIETEFLTVAAARAQHVRHLVQPALTAGNWVVCDRYIDSSRVYQGALGGIDPKIIDNINNFATGELLPDLTLLLDCDVEVSMARIGSRAENLKVEKSRFDAKPLTYHKKIRETFLALAHAEGQRFDVIDASSSTEQSVAKALERLQARGWI